MTVHEVQKTSRPMPGQPRPRHIVSRDFPVYMLLHFVAVPVYDSNVFVEWEWQQREALLEVFTSDPELPAVLKTREGIVATAKHRAAAHRDKAHARYGRGFDDGRHKYQFMVTYGQGWQLLWEA